MSLIGAAAVAKMAAPAAGRIAAAVGMKLARSRTVRRRVRKRVVRAVEFYVPRRPFALWLKRIDVATLRDPVEAAGPRLAQSLDWKLSGDARWRAQPDRHSRALTLVRHTYLAMEAESGDAEARILSSSWAEARHRVMVDALADLVGEPLSLSRADRCELLVRHSESRTETRLASFGIEPQVVVAALAAYEARVPGIESGEAKVLVGPYGSGKSELAELWFRKAVEEFRIDESVCQPMWLHASELISRSLVDEVSRRSSTTAGSSSTLSVVIDGLDEVDSTTAARVVAQARAFVRAASQARILLTCRPGVLQRDNLQILHNGLEREEAVALVEAIAGSRQATWRWDPTLIDAVRRPFFAIAAGVMIGEGARPSGQADLIGRLVERALTTRSGSTRATQDPRTFDLLTKLAVSTTKSGGRQDGLSFQERQEVLISTLVHQVGPQVEFSLPIFQQWFAGTAILSDSSLVSIAVSDADSFERWRWALAVACLGASTDQLDDILEACLDANPGAGSWILTQVSGGHDWYRDIGDDDVDASTAGQRLLRATRTWIDSLGELASSIFPVRYPSQPIGLGVRVSGKGVALGWLREAPESDTMVDLPARVHPFLGPDETWLPDRTGHVAVGDEWPWELRRKQIATGMLRVLETHPLIGGARGVWQAESRYRALRIVMKSQSMLYPPIDRDEARRVVEENLDVLRTHGDIASWSVAGFGTIYGEQMADLAGWLRDVEAPIVVRPVPVPDRDRPKDGAVWSLYSDDRLQHFYAEVLGMGCDAYDEAATGLFSKFTWSLGTGSPGDFGVLAELSFPGDGRLRRGPVINKMILPLDVMSEEIAKWGGDFLRSTNGRAAVAIANDADLSDQRFFERSQELLDQVGPRLARSGPFRRGIGWSSSAVTNLNHPRPASAVAARWIWNDLKAFKLADGTSPQLNK